MKSLLEILNEAHIGDLKGVRYIRHYTTLKGLANIINDGYIKANESVGDDYWHDENFDIGEEKVVSFHDSRYDPEIEYIIDANENNDVIRDTKTLGIHMEQICCFIEYNFDLLPKKIQKKANFIKILEGMVAQFCDKSKILHDIQEFSQDKLDKLNKVNTYGELLEFLRDCEWHYRFVLERPDRHKENVENFKELMNRKDKFKEFTKAEEKQLLNAAIKDDGKTVLNILKQHGWEKTDESKYPFLRDFTEEDYHDGFLNYVAKRFLKTNSNPIEVEIRIACDIPINIRGCTIYFFKGIADKVEEKGDGAIPRYIDFLKQLTLMPNVEIYRPGDDYSLIN